MSAKDSLSIGLSAAIVSVEREEPSVLVIARKGEADALPFGPFDPAHHRTLELGLREWVGAQTHFDLGYTEQLYTFGDKGRQGTKSVGRLVSVGYLALTRQSSGATPESEWRGWYHYFPWEDWRSERPEILDEAILPALRRWAERNDDGRAPPSKRRERLQLAFGEDGTRRIGASTS